MDYIEKIKNLCVSRGTTIKQLEKELGFSNGSIAKNGIPNSMRLYKIAKHFDVPMEYLIDDELVLQAFEEHEMLLSELDNLKKKPLYRVAAGEGAYNEDYSTETIEEDSDSEFFSAEVVGDSMTPVLNDKDIVLIQPQIETNPHDLSLVKVDGEHATIKYVEVVDNGLWLRAENKEVFKDKFYSVQEIINLPIKVIGKVVELRRKI